jgi:transposase
MMKFYTQQHRFYCGIDLHARTMFVCILDSQGREVLSQDLPSSPDAFLHAIAPFRDGLVVGVECMFAWYWLADVCAREEIPFVLGHALYMKAIHGGKTKNDAIDARKIAGLLRGGLLPTAYVYPAAMRGTRDLLRRRTLLVRRRAELLTHVQILHGQYNLPAPNKRLSYAANRTPEIAERFADASVRKMIEIDLALIDQLDEHIGAVELHLTRTAKVHDPQSFARLQSIPGVGKVLALVLLYEIHDIRRFADEGQFLSYARLVRCSHESAGKKLGSGPKKIGSAPLRWALGEAACLMLRCSDQAKRWQMRMAKKKGPAKTLGILAAQIGRVVYHLLRKGEVFDASKFFGS